MLFKSLASEHMPKQISLGWAGRRTRPLHDRISQHASAFIANTGGSAAGIVPSDSMS